MAHRGSPGEFEGSVCGPIFWGNGEPGKASEQMAVGLFLFCLLFLLFGFTVLLRMFLSLLIVGEKIGRGTFVTRENDMKLKSRCLHTESYWHTATPVSPGAAFLLGWVQQS